MGHDLVVMLLMLRCNLLELGLDGRIAALRSHTAVLCNEYLFGVECFAQTRCLFGGQIRQGKDLPFSWDSAMAAAQWLRLMT